MKHVPERAVGTAVMAGLALALLGAAWLMPWFEYDATSGRQTPPDGAYNDGEDGITRQHLTVYATHWRGDIDPDPSVSGAYALWVPIGLAAAAAACLVAALGEIPRVHRFIHRRVALGVLAGALAMVALVAVLSWSWLPEMLAGQHVDSQFAARLDEPDGYTESNLQWGWYALASSALPIIGAGLFKFQAGAADLESVHARLGEEAA